MIAMPGLGGINPLELKQKLKPVGGSSNAPQVCILNNFYVANLIF